MLINSLRFYERILLGLSSPDESVQASAKCCLSWFSYYMSNPQVVLPELVVHMLADLPKGVE